MIIRNSAVNIMFSRVNNVKKQYILNEFLLQDNFNEASILPIPDEVPTEIPRIVVKTKGEHSQLSIAPEAAIFETMYTDEYLKNWNLCETYIKSRIEDVFALTDKLALSQYKYMGIVTNLLWDDVSEDGNKVLYNNLFRKTPLANLDDLMVKYTYVENEKFYVNITLQSIKVFDDLNDNKAGNYCNNNIQQNTIGITLDINDRYSYNQENGYKSDKKRFDELMKLTTSIIDEKIVDLVQEGRY